MDRLIDCCWVEIEGEARPQLVIRKRLKPLIFAVGEWLYSEYGMPLPHNPDAPRILVIMHPRTHGRRRAG
jgi:hypothetical protein